MYESLPGGKGLVKSMAWGGREQGDIVETEEMHVQRQIIISPQ